jgi:hypothetical protein
MARAAKFVSYSLAVRELEAGLKTGVIGDVRTVRPRSSHPCKRPLLLRPNQAQGKRAVRLIVVHDGV